MANITYHPTTPTGPIIVRLEGKRHGQIVSFADGFRYRTFTGFYGETFATVAEVKASLQTDA